MKLKNKIAIVRGGALAGGWESRGIWWRGRFLSAVTARTETEGNKTIGTIHKTAEEIGTLGVPVLAVKCDVTRGRKLRRRSTRLSNGSGA